MPLQPGRIEAGEAEVLVHPDGRRAVVVGFNALRDAALPARPDAMLLVLRSGWTTAGEGRPAWLPGARSRWEEAAGAIEEWSEGTPVAILPTVDDVVSDVPSTLAFLGDHPGWGLMLEPMALLTAAMEMKLVDYLGVIASGLGEHPALAGLILPPAGAVGHQAVIKAFPGACGLDWVGVRQEERVRAVDDVDVGPPTLRGRTRGRHA